VVDVAKDEVAETGTVHGVLRSESNTAGTDDDDDKRVESARRHQAMHVSTYSACTNAPVRHRPHCYVNPFRPTSI